MLKTPNVFTTYKMKHYPQSDKYALILDPRYDNRMKAVIYNFMYFMNPHGWNLIIISSKLYESQIKTDFPNACFIHLSDQIIEMKDNIPNISIATYNNIFTTTEFWKLLPGNQYAVFQKDCVMFKMFDPIFEQYDYAGANFPLSNSPIYGGLNGGFSLRRKNAMIQCLENVTIQRINKYRISMSEFNKEPFGAFDETGTMNEDIYFSHACEILKFIVPDKIHRNSLAIEGYPWDNTCVYHGWDKNYQTTGNCMAHLSSSLLKTLLPIKAPTTAPAPSPSPSVLAVKSKSQPEVKI